MPCTIKNPANVNLGDMEDHIHGMYDFFDQKLGFKKPPTMVFDSDPSNQSNILGKTAYYDPQSLEIHIYSDGRHPKDMLRSIAHELIHHQQNMEGRLDVGGYNGPGYYLENDKLRKIEHEAMLDGNALMREYEDTIKKENNQMSLKEWKNKELNTLLLKKFGILKENCGEQETRPWYHGPWESDWDRDQQETEEPILEEQEEAVNEEEVVEEQLDTSDSEEEEEDTIEENKVDIKEVVQRVLENNKKVMQKLKDN